MPRRKQKKVIKKITRPSRSSRSTQTKRVTSSRISKLKNIRQKFDGWKWTESYNSFLLGIVVVIVAVLFVASFIRQQNKIQDTSSIATEPTATLTPTPTPGTTIIENGNTYYIVKANDSLWNIAVTIYNDGYKWTEIAKANNLANPGTIFRNDKLLIPNPPQPSTLGQIQRGAGMPSNAITSNSYTVQKDDTLWEIAVRAYADGYKWTEIAKVNNLSNPDVIHSGNILTIPR